MRKSLVLAVALLAWLAGIAGAQSTPPSPTVQFTLSNYYAFENSGTAEITVTLTGDAGGNTVTVDYATADGTATAGADYGSSSGTLTFTPGVTSQTFTIKINTDLYVEGDETVLLSLSNPSNAVLGTPSTATLTIWDNPPPTVQFDIVNTYVSENTGYATIQVTLLGDAGGQTVTVDYSTADGTASAGADYVSASGTLTFPPGTYSQTFTVTVNRDLLTESDETVMLSLSSPTNAILGTNSSALLTIWDSPPPSVQFDMTSYTVSESTGTVTFTATLTGDPYGDTVTVNYSTADGTASAGADYTSASGTLTFSPGTYSQSFTVTVNRDLITESDETVMLSLSSPTNAILGTNSSALLTIWDSPPPSVQFDMTSYTVSESTGTVTFTATLTGDPYGDTVTVNYATADGTASAGADYTSASGTLTFSPGTYSQSFTVTVNRDLLTEGDETVMLSLSSPTNAILGTNSSALLTISDSPPPSVQFDMSDYYVGEEGMTATITVTLSGDTGGDTVTVNYATADGSANAGADYSSTSGTLTFSPGTYSQSFTVSVNRDLLVESSETVLLSLSGVTNAVIGSQGNATLTIWDSPPPSVQLDMTSYTVSENMGTATITVTLTGSTYGDTVTVDYATADGSASAGADYVAAAGTLTFSPGTYSQSFTVTVNRDLLIESDETVLVSLSNPTNAILGSNTAATLTITDSPPPSVQLMVSSYTVSEGDTAEVTVTLTGDAGGNTVTVDYATSDGTATAGADYVSTSGTLTFPPGTTSQTFMITTNHDLVVDSDETVSITLSNPTNAVLGSPSVGLLNIWDVPPPTVQFDVASYTANETAGTVTVTVSLTGDTSGNTVTVDYATADGSATAGLDYVASSGTLTFPPGVTSQTFDIAINRDTFVESDETVLITLSNPTNAILGTTSAATLTILDCAPPTVQFDVTDYYVSEGGTATITVTLTGDTYGDTVTVDYATADGSASAGDYTSASGTLTFAPGVTSQTFTVDTTMDSIAENDETVLLMLSNPINAILGDVSSATLTIWEVPPPTVQFDATSYTVSESAGQATITVTLSAAASWSASVDYATTDGTAVAGTDYSMTSGTLTFAPGEISKTFTVPIIDVGESGPTKDAILTLSNPSGCTLGTPSTATLTILDDDPPPPTPPTVQIQSPTYVVAESEGQAIITVTLSAAAPGSVTVDYATADGAAPDGAEAGTNYLSASGTLTFNAGEISKTFTIDVLDDGVNGPTLKANISISNPTGATLGSQTTSVLSIVDSTVVPPDPPPTDVVVNADDVMFDPSPAAVDDFVSATLTAQAVRPVSDSLSSPTWNWQYIGLESSMTSLSGPWDPATSNGYSIMSASCPSSDSTYDYSAVTITTSFASGAYYQMTFEAQVGYTDALCCYSGRRQCCCRVIIVGVDKIIVKNSNPENQGPAHGWVGEAITLQVWPSPAVPFWPAGWPQWTAETTPAGSTVGNPFSPWTEATITPDKKGDYTFKAACGGSSKTFNLTAHKLLIEQKVGAGAYSDITDGTPTVMVGQKIDLRAKIDPALPGTATPPKYKWTIPGSTVKTYVMTHAQGKKTELKDPDDYKNAGITYYWVKKLAPGQDVELKVTLDAGDKTAKSKFTANRPTFDEFKSTTTTNTPGIDCEAAAGAMHFGNAGSPGITWTAKATAPAGGAGKLGFLQMMNTEQNFTLNDDTKNRRTSQGVFVLDRLNLDSVFYGASETNIAASAQATHGPLSDSPQLGFGGRKKISIDDKFEIRLMYRPDAGTAADNIYVTIGLLKWDWKGACTKGGGGVWTMDAAGTFTKDPAGADDDSLPEWNARWQTLPLTNVPVVTKNVGNLAKNAATIVINGSGFNADPAKNTVTFNLGATGTVTAATATQLTVTFNTQPTVGNLTAVVNSTIPNNNSGAPVQVATVVEP